MFFSGWVAVKNMDDVTKRRPANFSYLINKKCCLWCVFLTEHEAPNRIIAKTRYKLLIAHIRT